MRISIFSLRASQSLFIGVLLAAALFFGTSAASPPPYLASEPTLTATSNLLHTIKDAGNLVSRSSRPQIWLLAIALNICAFTLVTFVKILLRQRKEKLKDRSYRQYKDFR